MLTDRKVFYSIYRWPFKIALTLQLILSARKALECRAAPARCFIYLEENGYMDAELTEKMVSAVGFRNLIVHEYRKVEMREVFKTAHENLEDVNEFLRAIVRRLDLTNEKSL